MAKSFPMTSSDDLIPSVEATEILGVGRSTLTRWVQSGRLPEAVKIPGTTGARLFRRSDVERLAEELAHSPAEEAEGAA